MEIKYIKLTKNIASREMREAGDVEAYFLIPNGLLVLVTSSHPKRKVETITSMK